MPSPRGKRLEKIQPYVANQQSPHKTPLSVQIEIHYAKLGIIGRWDWARYRRIAYFCNYTVYELASLLCVSHKTIDVAKAQNRFPSSVCMLLTLFEAQLIGKFTDDVIRNPFPSFDDPPKGS